MAVERASHVTLSGDLSGDYVIVKKHEDGSLVLAPDTSATLEEFEADYGPLQPPDGEG